MSAWNSRYAYTTKADLNYGQLGVPRHRTREVVCRVAEHAVPDLVHLPRPDKGNVSSDGRLQNEPSAIELARLLLVARNGDTSLEAPFLQSERYRALLDGRGGTSGREERGETGCMRVQPSDEGALRDEFQRYLAVQVQRLEVLVPVVAWSVIRRTDMIRDFRTLRYMMP